MTMATVLRTCGACQEQFSDNDVYEAHCHEHMVGFCPKCRRWDHWGEKCPRCGGGFDGQEECHQELRHQFSELVLALQDVVQHGEIGRPDNGKGSVSLDPRAWGTDPRGIVKAAMNPLFWANMTSQDLRMAIGLLSSVAGQYGVTTVGTRQAGSEVTMTHDDGSVHLYWRDGKSGNMSHIREVDAEALAAQFGPEVIKEPRMVECSTCHQPFAAGQAIIVHRREHQT